jgi:DNA-binding transcriptional MerR regulator
MNSATLAPTRRRARTPTDVENSMAKQTYSISDLAQELDVTTRAIRFYEEQGMLSPQRRGQERIYSPKDRVALKLILRGKRLGFSLAECKTLIELYDPQAGNKKQLNSMLALIAERRRQLEQQLLDIRQMQLELDTAEERCRAALLEIDDDTIPPE